MTYETPNYKKNWRSRRVNNKQRARGFGLTEKMFYYYHKIKKAVAPAKPKATAKTTPKTKAKTTNNIKKTNYKGDSIVDGLKSVGVNSSYDNRKKIAQANGIKNYTGTPKQNTELLNKLKKGTLKKAK